MIIRVNIPMMIAGVILINNSFIWTGIMLFVAAWTIR